MNTHVADTAAGDRLKSTTAPAAIGPVRTLQTLVRREFWEHPWLWRAPLVMGGLLVAVILFAIFVRLRSHVIINDTQHHGIWDLAQMPASSKVALLTLSQWGLSVPLYLVTGVVLSFYLLDCLYAERKDRSILFWKSLPVSDGLTVASKAIVALVAVPLILFLTAIGFDLVCLIIWQLQAALGTAPAVFAWDTMAWLRTELLLLLCLVLAILWYAPIAALFLVVSAWVRRGPIVWVIVPLLFALIVEGIFSSIVGLPRYLNQFVGYRLLGIWGELDLNQVKFLFSHDQIRPLDSLLGTLNWTGAFANVNLWLGVIAAGALMYAAVRIRRYRDET